MTIIDATVQLSASTAFRITAWLGFAGVALGAFGAHGLKDFLMTRHMTTVWEKAVLYHFIHVLVMLLLAVTRPFRSSAWTWLAFGILLFSGSLYAWALTAIHWLVYVTPVGGICLLIGWFSLASGRIGLTSSAKVE